MDQGKKIFKSLEIIFISILSMQIFIALLLYILRDANIIELGYLEFEYLPLVVLVINTSCILFAKYIFTARNKIDRKLTLAEKLNKYRNYSFLIISLLDFLNIVNIIVFFLSGRQIYLLVALLILILYVAYRPSKIKFADTLLTSDERSKFINENNL